MLHPQLAAKMNELNQEIMQLPIGKTVDHHNGMEIITYRSECGEWERMVVDTTDGRKITDYWHSSGVVRKIKMGPDGPTLCTDSTGFWGKPIARIGRATLYWDDETDRFYCDRWHNLELPVSRREALEVFRSRDDKKFRRAILTHRTRATY